MKHPTIGSLFSGRCDGIALGLQWAGCGDVVWHCELEARRRAVLRRHWPDAIEYSDVREVGVHDLPCMLDADCDCHVVRSRVDIVCGGFPCQDVSNTGKKKGIDDGERSGLWREYARAVGELRPGVVFVENVPGVLRRGWGRVLGDLAGLGFDAEWCTLSGTDLGFAVRRPRVFLLACAGEDGRAILRQTHDNHRRDEGGHLAYRRHAGLVPPGPGDAAALHAWIAEHPAAEPGIRRDLARLPDRVDRVAGLGDSASPLLVFAAWHLLRMRMMA